MSISVSELTSTIVNAAKGELEDHWPEIKEYAKAEARKMAESIKMIGKLTAQGRMSPAAAKIHLRIQKNATSSVLLTIEGLGLLTVEKAINASINAIKDIVNTGVGFKLI